jgi:hypothetical protein
MGVASAGGVDRLSVVIIVGEILGSDREDFVSKSSLEKVPPEAVVRRLRGGKSLLAGGRGGPKARRAFADPLASMVSIAIPNHFDGTWWRL